MGALLLVAPSAADAGHGGGGHGGGGHGGAGHFGSFGGHFGGGGHAGGYVGGGSGFGAARTGMYTGTLLGYSGQLGMPNFGVGSGLTPRAYAGHGLLDHPPAGTWQGMRSANSSALIASREAARSAYAQHSIHDLTNVHYSTVINRAAFSRAGIGRANAFANERWGGKAWDARRLHRRGRFGAFFLGAVFWPYDFGDFLSWAFWPEDYYDSFWGYGPDALLWGAFWPHGDYGYGAGDPDAAASAAGDIYSGYRAAAPAVASADSGGGARPEEVAQECSGFSPGLSELPLDRLAEVIHPTDDQRAPFEELKAAAARAKEILSKSCPTSTPTTPVARLDAMKQRLEALLQAEQTVRQPLEHLYGSLAESQKQALKAAANADNGEQVGLAELCSSEASFANAPADQIERTVRLNVSQMELLHSLKQASNDAARTLGQTCPRQTHATLAGRLDEAETRIKALIGAVDTLRPRVDGFFAALTEKQRQQLSAQANVRSAANTVAAAR